MRARAAGVAPEKMMFSGVGKTARELALAVDHGILCVNVESEAELEFLAAIAAGKAACGHLDPGQSRHRPKNPRQDRDRQGGEQVRHTS